MNQMRASNAKDERKANMFTEWRLGRSYTNIFAENRWTRIFEDEIYQMATGNIEDD